MSFYSIRKKELADIADAIRAKTGKSDGMSVEDMPKEIERIETPKANYLLPETVITTVANTSTISGTNYYISIPNTTDYVAEAGDKIKVVWSGETTTLRFIPYLAICAGGEGSGTSAGNPWVGYPSKMIPKEIRIYNSAGDTVADDGFPYSISISSSSITIYTKEPTTATVSIELL